MYWRSIFSLLFCLPAFAVMAQIEISEPPAPEEVEGDYPFYHQIFIDDTLQEIKKVVYDQDTLGRELEYKPAPDGRGIHLINYDRKSRVKVEYVNRQGKEVKLSKPVCHIHSLQYL